MNQVQSLITLLLLAPALVAQSVDKSPKSGVRDYVLQEMKRHAYGCYVQDHKIGWIIDELKLGRHGGKEVAIDSSETYFKIKRDGITLERFVESKTYFSLEGDGRVLLIEKREKESGVKTVYRAENNGKTFVITVDRDGTKSRRSVAIPKRSLRQSMHLHAWLLGKRTIGEKFDSSHIDLKRTDIEQKSVYEFRGNETIAIGGVPTKVHKVLMFMDGAKIEGVIQSNGAPLRATIGVMEVRAELEKTVKNLDDKGIDLMRISSIFVDKDLGDPRQVRKLTLEIGGLGDYKLPTSHRQRLTRDKDGKSLVHLTQDAPMEKGAPLSKKDHALYLAETPSVQCKSEKIRNLAKKIVGDEKDPVKATKLLNTWVYLNLRKSMAANASTAEQVLKQEAGDCTEHSLLFVALARAAGVPAKIVGGVAFLNAGKPMFGWHAWAEIHDGKQWVTVDPTWNELFVDATHLKFDEGDEGLAALNVMGKVKLKVVSFESKE